jgi:hypothetical protein
MRPHSNLGNDAVYHLDLFLEKDTATAIQAVFNNGSFEDDGFMVHSPLLGQTLTLSTKLKALQKLTKEPMLLSA